MNAITEKIRALLGLEKTLYIPSLTKILTKTNPIIIEAGASDGKDTVKFADLFPDGTIYAFEPIPESYETLISNTHGKTNVKTFPEALGPETGHSSINVSSNRSSSSLLAPRDHLKSHPDIKFNEKLEIKLIGLDDFVEKEKIKRIDFMWLDLQGMEYQVLSSAPKSLKIIDMIYTEVSLTKTYEGVMLYEDFNNWMGKQGFKLVQEWLPWQDMGNALYKRD